MSALLISCAHGVVDELPTAPSAVIHSLTITPVGGGTLIAGRSAPITSTGPLPDTGAVLGAFARYRDGSGKYIEAAWSTSDPQVLVVSGGALVPMARGTAVLTARAGGLTASETFAVEPNMAGSWTGGYVIDQCGAGSTAMFDAVCSAEPTRRGMFAPGTAAPLSLEIHKDGEQLTATAQFGGQRGTLRGTDRGQNYLTLTGDLAGNRTTFTIAHWDARVRTDLMEGFIGFEIRIEGLPNIAAVAAHLDNVQRR
jgi:hypothetical protein